MATPKLGRYSHLQYGKEGTPLPHYILIQLMTLDPHQNFSGHRPPKSRKSYRRRESGMMGKRTC